MSRLEKNVQYKAVEFGDAAKDISQFLEHV
jgi:hypothetical protein